MVKYRLAIEYKGIGIKTIELTEEELIEWLDKTVKDDSLDGVKKFSVEEKEE